MIRFIGSFFGAIFTMITLGILFAALSIGAIFYMYSRDLPSYESLAQYTPPTISRIYSGEGRLMDEFARERRIFAASQEIPDLVKNAFISAEDKNFYTHKGYDVPAAAQTYFNKILSQLSAGEAAYLAALPKSPGRGLHPVRDYARAVERRDYVLREMWQNGFIDEATYRSEKAAPLKTVQNGDYPAFRDSMPPRDYFTDEIRRQLSGTFGEKEFFEGGLTIRATVDPELQKAAAKALQERSD